MVNSSPRLGAKSARIDAFRSFADGGHFSLALSALLGLVGPIPATHAADGGEGVAFCDVDLNRTAKVKKKFPEAKIFQDYREMFAGAF